MYATNNQIERAYGFLLLDDSNKFIYCCKQCLCIFDSGSKLEAHILSEDHDKKTDIESVFLTTALETVSDEQPNSIKDETAEAIVVKIEPEVVVERKAEDNWPIVQKTNRRSMRLGEASAVPPHYVVKSIDDEPSDEPVNSSSRQPKKKKKSRKLTSKVGPKTKCTQNLGPFRCDSCPDITFKTKDTLKQHMRRHLTKKVRQVCEICQKKPKNYEKHMRMNHLEERPYKCDFCDSIFKNNASRVIHMRTHTGERRFVNSN